MKMTSPSIFSDSVLSVKSVSKKDFEGHSFDLSLQLAYNRPANEKQRLNYKMSDSFFYFEFVTARRL